MTPFHLPASLSTPSLRLAAAASIILFGLGLAACGDDPKPAVQPCGGACAIGMQCDAITNTCVSIAGNNAGNNTPTSSDDAAPICAMLGAIAIRVERAASASLADRLATANCCSTIHSGLIGPKNT